MSRGTMLGLVLVFVGLVIIESMQVSGCHMTRGEILVAYWPRLVIGFVVCLIGYLVFVVGLNRDE